MPTDLRFLIDNAVSPLMAELLRREGFDAVHLRDRGIGNADDDVVFALAAQEGRILVSLDTDFGNLLALRHERQPSVILFRRKSGRRPEAQFRLLMANLAQIAESLRSGSMVVLEQTRIRVRALPIGGSLSQQD